MRRTGRLPAEQLAPCLLEVPAEPGRLNYETLFGNANPLELEVGCGKGLFLVNAAGACPHVNFLGVEIERKYQLFTATRLAKRSLNNVRVVCADGRVFVRDWLLDRSLQAVHVYFPDPWWKNRHRKRRVFTAEFAGQCERVLQLGGHLYVASDVAEYFQVMRGLLAGCAGLRPLPAPELKAPQHDLDYLTNFERKYRKEGRPIHRAAYVRVEPPS